ncbi:MAG: 50S ribosomal protein L18e [Candidatus Diapherotrites archaeon]|nr:50S ribosomal protein L18e [Candidatus Diapherotrites archaeon]
MISKKIAKTKLGKEIKKRMEKSRKNKAEVNIGKIAKYTKKGDKVVVVGKVLGMGSISHAVTVAALAFSKSAKEKIEKAGGKAIRIHELEETKGVKLMA